MRAHHFSQRYAPCAMRSALSVLDHVGYFLSPLDFLKERFTFFLFKAAFKRFVFFRLFILSSIFSSPFHFCQTYFFKNRRRSHNRVVTINKQDNHLFTFPDGE
jgi:hypothetical protein